MNQSANLGFPGRPRHVLSQLLIAALLAAIALGVSGLPALAATGDITTVAGDGTAAFLGDGGPPATAELNHPQCPFLDNAGNIYFADGGNTRVRFINRTAAQMTVNGVTVAGGTIGTLAGNGTIGFSGDGGPASAASLGRNPQCVVKDRLGNLYIADAGNNRVRKVDVAGMISTYAGDGTAAFGGDSGPAATARLNFPAGLALDGTGALYVADTFNQRVRKIDAAGIISTVAGAGTSGSAGDGGPAVAAQLANPIGVTVRGTQLYIADQSTGRIRLVDLGGTTITAFGMTVAAGNITTVAGGGSPVPPDIGDGGPATSAKIDLPFQVAIAPGPTMFISAQGQSRIRKVDYNDVISTVAGTGTAAFSGDGGPATAAELDGPCGVAVDRRGTVIIADYGNNRIRSIERIAPPRRPPAADLDGDGTTDIAVYRDPTSTWYQRNGATVAWGTGGDVRVPANYSGSGATDIAVFRPSTGTWYIRGSAAVRWGGSGDTPVPADYDGDGKADIAVFRPSTGIWYIHGSAGTDMTVAWGSAGDIPVPGYYHDGSATDIAVFRPSTGTWYVKGSVATVWGVSGDIPVPGDYNGDGTTDIAVFRPSTGIWYVNGGPTSMWGASGDIPSPGDYDGQGITHLAVYRASTGTWYEQGGATVRWGTAGDEPLPLPAAILKVYGF